MAPIDRETKTIHNNYLILIEYDLYYALYCFIVLK